MRNRAAVLLGFAFLLSGAEVATAGDSSATYSRDVQGRLETVTTAEGITRYTYFDDGIIATVEHPDGTRDTFDRDDILAGRRLARVFREKEAGAFLPLGGSGSLSSESFNRFAFTGHIYEPETGLYLAKARYYDPQTGRFITQDSHLGDIADPPSLHRYMYGHDNPTRFIDPTGHSDADANQLAAAMHKRIGFLAADHRPAHQRGWWYNFGQEVYVDLPPRLIPMGQFEGLANQDAGRFAQGTAETVVASIVPPAVKKGAGALVARFPRLGQSVTEAAGGVWRRLRAPAPPAELPTPPAETVTVSVSESARSNGAFMATEEGHLVPLKGVSGGSQADTAGRVRWVDESAFMQEGARSYQAGAEGSRSTIATRQMQSPEVTYTDARGVQRTVKFDGQAGDVLIDRKTSVTTYPKAQQQALRQSEALRQNDLGGQWEVPNAAEAARATKMFERLGITNIKVVVKPQ